MLKHFSIWSALWALVLGLFVAALPGPALADAAHNGSWTHSCTETIVSPGDHVLKGYCGQGNGSIFHTAGRRHTTLIRYDLCSGDIWNDHGHLECTVYPQYQWGIPSDASTSCRHGFTADNYYQAKCKRKDADKWLWTSVPASTKCPYAGNNDGTLVCSTTPPQAKGGGGGGYPVTAWPLCDVHLGAKNNVTGIGTDANSAITQWKSTVGAQYQGDLVTAGVCQFTAGGG